MAFDYPVTWLWSTSQITMRLTLSQILSDLSFPQFVNKSLEKKKALLESYELLTSAMRHRLAKLDGRYLDHAETEIGLSFSPPEETLESARIRSLSPYVGHTMTHSRIGETETLPFPPKAHAKDLELLEGELNGSFPTGFVERDLS